MHWSLTTPFSAVEIAAVLALWVAALATPRSWRARLGRLAKRAVGALARRPVLGLGLLSLGWNLFPLCFYRPIPNAHDEFSYLLMADTFLEGRLTNPSHPMWRSFETFHVLQQPSYASKYPPFQGLVLAFGRAFFGHPSLGVKLVGALAAVAVWWALRGFLTRFWATVGALVFALHFGGFSYWSQSFFGGAAAALGGALVLGAVPRLTRAGLSNSFLLGAGLAILANSRPYEGLLLAVPCLGYVIWRGRHGGVRFALRLVPAALVAGTGLAGLGYYNHAVTGSATTFPYELYTDQYGYAKPFWFQTPQYDLVLDDEVMARFVETFEKRRYRISFAEHWRPMLRFYAAPVLLVPLVLLFWLRRHRRSRFPMTLLAIAGAGLALTTFILPHYAAPFSALLVLLLVQCLRLMRTLDRRWRGSRAGSYLFGTVVIAWLLAWVAFSGASAVAQAGFQGPGAWSWERSRIEAELESLEGRHLVFVRYGKTHSVHEEWVYNRADIDGAPVVWARELGSAQDAIVDRYFCGRDVWRVEPDAEDGVVLKKLRSPVCAPDG